MAKWLTPPDIAKRLGVKPERVRSWILSGELDAVNVSDGHQPRYRVSQEALDLFLKCRAVVKPKPPKRRRKAEAATVEYY